MWTTRGKPTEWCDGDREPERVRLVGRTFRASRRWHHVVNCGERWAHWALSADLHRTRAEAEQAIALGVLSWGRRDAARDEVPF